MRPTRVLAALSLATVLATAPQAFAHPRQGEPAPAAAAPAGPQPTDEAREQMRERLSRSLAARARFVLERQQVFLGVLDNSRDLMKAAIALEPDNVEIWRLATALAAILEDGDEQAAAWLSESITRVSKLDPTDQVTRMRRVLDVVSKKQTAEERIAAARKLLTPESIETLGAPLAARIAYDLAVLLRQTGDMRGFQDMLLQACDLDPSYPDAVELAAGYFRMTAPNAAAETQAVRAAMLANPTAYELGIGLAQLCLEHGAYRAAADVLEIHARLGETRMPDADYDGILTDYLVALWGSGRPELAFSIVQHRQELLDATLRAEIERQGMSMTTDERASTHLPPAPALATAVAALSNAVGRKDAPIGVANAATAFDTVISQMEKRKELKEDIAPLLLQSALVQLWLSGDTDRAQILVQKAGTLAPLSDDAKARFDGWIALRRKDAAKARELLAPLAAKDDITAKLGLALAQQELGEKRDAAKNLLEIIRDQPETAMGLWARARLYALVGAAPQVIPEAEAVEAAAALPPQFLQMMRMGGSALLLRVTPRDLDMKPWDPMYFDVDLTNRSAWPLGIGPDGPIKDAATVSASINIPGEMPRPPQVVLLPIDRKFVLAPGESVRVPIDLSLTDASPMLRDDLLSGAFISLHAIVNWRTTAVGFEPSPLGVEVESPVVHVSGERVTKEWVEASLAQLRDVKQVPNPELIPMIASAIVRRTNASATIPADAAAALDGAGAVLADAAKRLWPDARAWLVFACPKGKRPMPGADGKAAADTTANAGTTATVPDLEALDAVLRADESALTRMSWMAVRVEQPEDPALVASLASADPAVRKFAESCKQWLTEARDERAKELHLKQ